MAFEISELLNGKKLPNSWSVGLVGNIAKVNATSISKRFPPKKIRYIDISSVGTRVFDKPKLLEYSEAPSRAQRIVKDGDSLIATVRPNLRAFTYINKAEENLIASTGFACVTANDRSDSLYLYYYLTCEPFIQYLVRFADGAAYPAFDYKLIPVAEIPLPPPTERKNIGKFLGAIDERIALLRDTSSTLEAISTAVFKSWFVDFDPVRAKQEGRQPEGMDEATAALFPDTFETTELGEIPKGWKNELLENLVIPKRGKTITKAKCIEGDVPVVAGGLEPAYFHNQSNVASPVITVSASGANAGFVRLYQQDVWASDCSYLSKEQTPLVFYWYLFLKLNQEKIYFMQQGAAQPHIYPSDLMRLNVCYPENAEITKIFNDLVTPLFERIRVANEEIHNLANLRDTLLPRLISGQLRLPDAEEQIEAAKA